MMATDKGNINMEVEELRAAMDKFMADVTAKLTEINASKTEVANLVSAQVKEQKDALSNDVDVKLTGVTTDIKELRKVAKDLPKDGNLDSYIKDRIEHVQVLETMGLAGGSMDDTLDISYGEHVSTSHLIEGAGRMDKSKITAPGELKNSMFDFWGPDNNTNWVNCYEKHFSNFEQALIAEIPVIPDRYTYFESLSISLNRSTREGGAIDSAQDVTRRIERQLKWNDNFNNFSPDWDIRVNFEDYFTILWRGAEENLIDDPSIIKKVLYKKVMKAKPDMVGLIATPERFASASAFKYYLQLRRILSPYADGETAAKLFYTVKQNDGQPLDLYFTKKLKAYKNMHPSSVNARQWREFYDNVARGLKHKELARDMSKYGESIKNPENYGDYLNYMVKRGAHYISWANNGQGETENIDSCFTTATKDELECKKESKNDKIVINEVKNGEINRDESGIVQNDPHSEGQLAEFIDSTDPITGEQLLNVIAALNTRMKKNFICWWCNKDGHAANECFIKRDGKPPLPNSRFGKMNKNKENKGAATRFQPSSRPISDQFARQVNQVEAKSGGDDKLTREIEYLIAAGMEANQNHTPI